jgi:hypothetical protein
MMRLRLEPHVEEYVVDWSNTATGEDRGRIAEFLETLADGSWDTRWYRDPDQEQQRPGLEPRPYRPAPEWTIVWPDKGLAVLMQIDEQPGAAERHVETWVEEIRIRRIPADELDEDGWLDDAEHDETWRS